MGICCRLSDHGEEVDEAINRQLEAATKSKGLVLVGDFNTLTSAGGTTWQSTNSPGGFWKVLATTS